MIDSTILNITEDKRDSINVLDALNEKDRIEKVIDSSEVDCNMELESDFLLKVLSDTELF